MLDFIRSSAQSFGVKIAFGVIILVFIFWGVGNFNERDYSNVVAMVNGQPILATEFEKAYQSTEEYILRNNPGMTREQLAKDHLGRQVLRDLIQATLIQQEAERAGMEPTPLELRVAVEKLPAFHNAAGKFDPEAYKRTLEVQRKTPAQFEKELGNELEREKMFGLVTAPVWSDPEESRHRYDFLREKRVISYWFEPAEKFLSQTSVTPEEIQAYYNAHKDEYVIPATVDVSYIIVKPEFLAPPESISLEVARKWYDANRSRFETPEQIKAAHILVPVAENAPEEEQKAALEKLGAIEAELAAGAAFGEVADKYNPEGAASAKGELGWIGRGQTVPPFEDAAFAANPGKVTEAVRSPFGWHLILVEDKKAAGIKPFEEVEGEIRKIIAVDEGAEKLADALDNLIEDNILQKPLDEAASRYGLRVERSGLVDQKALETRLGLKAGDGALFFNIAPGSPLDTAIEADGQYIIAKVEAAEPVGMKSLESVQADILKILKNEKALALAVADADARLKKLESDSALQKAGLKTSEPIERGATVPGFLPDEALSTAIFSTNPGSWLPHAFVERNPEGAGAFLARVDAVIPPPAEEFESVSELMKRASRQERGEAIYALLLQNLVDKAKIEIMNQAIIDRGQ